MARRSEKYLKALKDHQDNLEAVGLLEVQYREPLRLYRELVAQSQESQKALADAAKEEASKDEGFRHVDTDQFTLKLVANRTVNTDLLRERLSPAKWKRIVTIKESVTIESVENALKMQVITPEEADGVVAVKGFSATFALKTQEPA